MIKMHKPQPTKLATYRFAISYGLLSWNGLVAPLEMITFRDLPVIWYRWARVIVCFRSAGVTMAGLYFISNAMFRSTAR